MKPLLPAFKTSSKKVESEKKLSTFFCFTCFPSILRQNSTKIKRTMHKLSKNKDVLVWGTKYREPLHKGGISHD